VTSDSRHAIRFFDILSGAGKVPALTIRQMVVRLRVVRPNTVDGVINRAGAVAVILSSVSGRIGLPSLQAERA